MLEGMWQCGTNKNEHKIELIGWMNGEWRNSKANIELLFRWPASHTFTRVIHEGHAHFTRWILNWIYSFAVISAPRVDLNFKYDFMREIKTKFNWNVHTVRLAMANLLIAWVSGIMAAVECQLGDTVWQRRINPFDFCRKWNEYIFLVSFMVHA